ncbi:Fe-S cluster assembly protein SufD [bacterium]|nr:MAG: Fe-S cluster assembly protein SufD [bacterium]
MTGASEAKDFYQTHFSQIEKETGRNGQAWAREIREAAMSRFSEMGFPTVRDEEWKYTNVAPLAKIPFQPTPFKSGRPAPDRVERFSLGMTEAIRLVFVDGGYSPELSSLHRLPQGVQVGSLAAALHGEAGWVESHLARYADYQEHAFVALNTALMRDGAFVYVPEGRIVAQPIHLLFLSTGAKEATISHPRNLLVIGKGGQATIVESYTALENKVYFTNAVTELVVGENAVVEHYKLQEESEEAFHIATLQVRLDRNGNCSSHSIALGGILVRNEVNAVLDGEGGECALNGFYMVSGEQHVDNHTRIDHVKPHCTSRELYKGVLDGRSKGVFNGKIYVHKAAQKSDAKQTNNNLLLSRDASIDTKPQLEIYNNDVKCTHGSTIGQLDQDSIFYLRSRGIGVEAARSLLAYAFASDVMGRIRIEPMRAHLDKLLVAKFHHDGS